jgi:hypothetical protein
VNTAETSLRVPAREVRRFAPYHPWDRNFFLLWVLLISLCILAGFSREIIQQIETHQSAPPLIVLFHAAAFVGWLALLTAQVLLIRSRRVHIHRRLGVAGMVLAGAMVILGTAAALSMGRLQFDASVRVTPLLSDQIADMVAFAGLAGAAFLLRKQPAAHKRLILLATVSISDAGFARLLGWDGAPFPWLFELLRAGGGGGLERFWQDMGALCLGAAIMILALGVYDWITRRRLHPVYVAGTAFLAALFVLKVALMVDPLWKIWRPAAIRLIGL